VDSVTAWVVMHRAGCFAPGLAPEHRAKPPK
jgi:hypothetical protein